MTSRLDMLENVLKTGEKVKRVQSAHFRDLKTCGITPEQIEKIQDIMVKDVKLRDRISWIIERIGGNLSFLYPGEASEILREYVKNTPKEQLNVTEEDFFEFERLLQQIEYLRSRLLARNKGRVEFIENIVKEARRGKKVSTDIH